ncbi:S8 family serine peptidase [Cellvibrio sp. OA-2007]|uniref:S8 family serine peptidase n=1 Tax=Cellvibrio sp. OA-2007 TaxID=529823 RepID=UPI00078160C4|nr:S8 family serine peptidase [Cellvibrio sp. OA-2007]
MKLSSFTSNSLALAISFVGTFTAFSVTAQTNETPLDNTKIAVINGAKYSFSKIIDTNGEVKTQILNSAGKTISEREVPSAKTEKFDPRVVEWVKAMHSKGNFTETLSVDIALNLGVTLQVPVETGYGEIRNGEVASGVVNGRELGAKELNQFGDTSAETLRKLQREANLQRSAAVQRWAEANKLLDAKGAREALARGEEGLTASLTADVLARLIESNDAMIAGVEPTAEFKDDINAAMNATNITNWALPFGTTRGDGIGIYMTESGCANESRITNYDRLAGSETDHSRNVGAIIRSVSPNSFLYCRGSAVLPNDSDLDGVGGNDPIYITTRSNGDASSNNYGTTDRNWDNYSYNNSLVMFNSAGNSGGTTGSISTPGKGLNIIAVGNYNDSTNSINGGSSFTDPNIGNDKPELSAPGTSITAGGFTMTGTSMSCPHAAAFTADMMSSSTYLKYRPYLAKAKMLAGATDAISGGFDKVGLGGIDFLSAQYSGYWAWWSGNNSSWSTFDKNDGNSDGYITARIYISNGYKKARVALAWMNRGSYTYDHRNNAHAIGMDLDMRVYAPNGSFVGGSYSWDNSFEYVNFTPSQSGYYTVKINRFANRDTGSALRMGLYTNYYN